MEVLMNSNVLLSAMVVLTFGALAAGAADIPASVDPARIVNYVAVKPGLAFGGKLAPEVIAQLKGMGFKTVLNLRTEQEGAKDEEAVVKAQGLRYEWVPVMPDTLSLADVKKVEAVLDDKGAGPVLVHCASANRVAGVWAIIQVRRGKTVSAAIEEARPLGLKSPAVVAAVERLTAGRDAAPAR
jgi:uncharacterized protein (TIGR01244 family)